MAKKVYDSCVFKRDWRYYKTCLECGAKKTCVTYRKPIYWQLMEAVIVGWKRWRINRKLRRIFIRRTSPKEQLISAMQEMNECFKKKYLQK